MLKSVSADSYQLFLQWLVKGRNEKQLSIRQLALLLGTHSSVVGKIETGERRLDVFEYCQYCEALGLNPCEGLLVLNNKKKFKP